MVPLRGYAKGGDEEDIEFMASLREIVCRWR
jgi:hypothetical protein